MILSELDTYNSFKVTFKPNSSLTANTKQKVILLLTIIPAIIGITFCFLGLWLILPFIGLEIAALAYAFYYINQHEADYESISIEGDSIVIERCVGDVLSQEVINTYWLKVEQHVLPNGELHLYLKSHGKYTEVGRYLTTKQRELLSKQLKQRTGTFNRH